MNQFKQQIQRADDPQSQAEWRDPIPGNWYSDKAGGPPAQYVGFGRYVTETDQEADLKACPVLIEHA